MWPIGRVVEAITSSDGLVRSVKLKSSAHKDEIIRPIIKVVLLLKNDSVTGGGV